MILFLILGIILLVVAGAVLLNRRQYSERMDIIRRAVRANATDISRAVPGDVIAINGNVRHDQPLVSEQTSTPCVYYDFEIVRRYQRRNSGVRFSARNMRRRRRGRGGSRSETVAQNEQWIPFLLEDKSGHAWVNPDGALFDPRKVLNRYEHAGSNNPFGIPGLDINVGFGDQTLGHEVRENVIPTDAPAFVAGPIDESGAITRNGQHGLIISHRPESALRNDWGTRERRLLIGAGIAAGFGALSFFGAAVAYVASLF